MPEIGFNDPTPVVLGIDPGLTGAWAVLDTTGALLDVGDLPILDRGVDPVALALMLAGRTYIGAMLEWPTPMPGNGAKTAHSMGLTLGRIETVLLLAGIGVERVPPATWKRALRLSKDKTASRAMATRLWPKHAHLFARVRDDGRAEAALLARYFLDRKG